jgi:hypothetical protein
MIGIIVWCQECMPARLLMRRQQGRRDNGDERKGAGHDALNNIYSNGYAQMSEPVGGIP